VRVVHIARGLVDYVSGLVNAMAQVCETHVVVCQEDERMQELLDPKVIVFRSGAPRVRDPRNVFSVGRIRRYLKQVQPDVVHFQSGVLWELALAKWLSGPLSVATVHDVAKHPDYAFSLYPHNLFYPHNLMGQLGRWVTGIIVHSPRLCDEARRRFPHHAARDRLFVVPHGAITRYGVGTASFEPRNGGRILFFGGLSKYKGVENLIKAEPLIRRQLPLATIRIAGFSANPAYHGGLVVAGQRIELMSGHQSDEAVAQLFKWADVLVLPYIEASQSGVLLLGMAFGVPPVVTHVGGLPDVVVHESNGLLVPPHDVEALADAVVRLLSEQELRRRVIDNLAREAGSTYSWRSIAARTVEVYSQLAETRRT